MPDLVGGSPADLPDRYAVADPIRRIPLAAQVLCVHSRADDSVPFSQSSAYVTAAQYAGGRARLVETHGDHFTVIEPSSPDWAVVIDSLPSLFS